MRRLRLFVFVIVLQVAFCGVSLAQSGTDTVARAQEAYRLKQYAESAHLYLTAATQEGNYTAGLYYNAACSFALAGNKDDAFKYLRAAVDAGYLFAQDIRGDRDFDSIHGDQRWQELLAHVDTLIKRNDLRWNTPSLNTPFRENISEDEKIAGLSKLWAEVRYNFVNFDLVPDIDWDALYMEYLPKVRASKSTLEYYRLLTELMAKMKDGHTNVYYPNELYSSAYDTIPLRTRLIEDKVIVIDVYQDELRRSGIVSGLEVISINGVTVRQYAEQNVAPYQSSSTPQDLQVRTYEYSLLRGPLSEPLRLVFRAADGSTFERTIARRPAKELNAPQKPRFALEMLPQNIAYVKLNNFGDPKTADDFEQAFPQIEKADALILDVRDNGGGSTGVGYRILATLSTQPVSGSAWRTRNYRPTERAQGELEGKYQGRAYSISANGKLLYTKPVVVLTSARTFSAAEDFVVAFDVMKRGLIIGEPTAGSTGQPLFFKLPGGGTARICTKHDTYIDGREFVGLGIVPARTVRPTISDFRAGRDTVLNAAVDEIRKMTANAAVSAR